MSLGVLNNISALYATNTLNQTQASLQTVLQQLSSGSRINSGADDAAGLAVSNGLGGNIAALNQSTLNATEAVGLLQTADGALSQVTSLLNRAVTLATESANSTLNTTQVSAANQEYQNILAEINSIGSTTNYNGNNVFSANATTFLVSDGTAAGANVFSDSVGTLSSTSVGQTSPTATATTVTLVNPTPSGVSAAGTATVGQQTFTNTGAGATFTNATAFTVTVGNASATFGNGGISINTDTGAQLATAIQNALSAQGVTASYAGSTLTINGPANGSASVSSSGTLTTNTPGTITTAATTTAAVAATPATGGSAVYQLSNSTDTIAGTLTLSTAANTTAHSITVVAGTTLSQLANQINGDSTYSAYGISAAYNSTTGLLKISNTAAAGALTVGGTLQDTSVPQAGAGVNFTTSSVSTLNQGSAQAVLIAVTNAIQDVAYQRGEVGANSNQLNAASTVAASEAVNLTSAQTNILSTNYGEASSALAKYEVLSQTGISALAQANTVQQEVLKLLQ